MSELLPVFLPHLSSCAVWLTKVPGREEEEDEACKFDSLAQMEVRQHASYSVYIIHKRPFGLCCDYFFFIFFSFCTLIWFHWCAVDISWVGGPRWFAYTPLKECVLLQMGSDLWSLRHTSVSRIVFVKGAVCSFGEDVLIKEKVAFFFKPKQTK